MARALRETWTTRIGCGDNGRPSTLPHRVSPSAVPSEKRATAHPPITIPLPT